MDPQVASRTALGASLMRAVHTRTDPYPLLNDPWGDRLVPASVRAGLYALARKLDPTLPEVADDATAGSAVDAFLRASAAYAPVVTRSRYTEDALQRAVARGIRQYVLIGAGFDSYALRAPRETAGLVVVEIDHPATQALKRACIEQSGVGERDSVHYVAADLSTEDLGAVLRNAPLRIAEPAFFSWLGVTMYLDRDANRATLRAIASTAAPGSELVFTYIDQAALDAPPAALTDRALALRRHVARLGEPFVSGFDPATLNAELAQLGYALLEDLSGVELVQRCDPGDLNGLEGSSHNRIAHARVAGAGAA